MNLNKYLDIKPEVAEALAAGKPVVALESTIISHGMPYPQNVQTALEVERIVRENGAVPATIAVIGGRLKAGLTAEEIEYFGKKGQAIAKASRRDLAVLCARGEDGATTVTTTMIIANMAGIRVFATGGIGSIPGAVVGAFIIGIAENIIKGLDIILFKLGVIASPIGLATFSDAFTFALLIVILAVKPTGLFGEKTTEKV